MKSVNFHLRPSGSVIGELFRVGYRSSILVLCSTSPEAHVIAAYVISPEEPSGQLSERSLSPFGAVHVSVP